MRKDVGYLILSIVFFVIVASAAFAKGGYIPGEDTVSTADIINKADKVESAVSGNFANLDADGNLADSGSKASDFATAGSTHTQNTDVSTDAALFDFINGLITSTAGYISSNVSLITNNGTNYTEMGVYRTIVADTFKALIAVGGSGEALFSNYKNAAQQCYLKLAENGSITLSALTNFDITFDVSGTGEVNISNADINSGDIANSVIVNLLGGYTGNLLGVTTLSGLATAVDGMSTGGGSAAPTSMSFLVGSTTQKTFRGMAEYDGTTYVASGDSNTYTATIDMTTGALVKVDNYNSYSIFPFNGKLYAGGTSGDYSVFDGATWSRKTPAGIGSESITDFAEKGGYLFATTNYGKVYRMTSEDVWTLSYDTTRIDETYFVDDGTNLFISNYRTLYKLTDPDNDTWAVHRDTSRPIERCTSDNSAIYCSGNGETVKVIDSSTQQVLTLTTNVNIDDTGRGIYYDTENNRLYQGGNDMVWFIYPEIQGLGINFLFARAAVPFFDEDYFNNRIYKHSNGNIYFLNNYGISYPSNDAVIIANSQNDEMFLRELRLGDLRFYESTLDLALSGMLNINGDIRVLDSNYIEGSFKSTDGNISNTTTTISTSSTYGTYKMITNTSDARAILPAASAGGWDYTFVHYTAGNNAYVDCAGSDTFDGTNNRIVLTAEESAVALRSTGTDEWFIIAAKNVTYTTQP